MTTTDRLSPLGRYVHELVVAKLAGIRAGARSASVPVYMRRRPETSAEKAERARVRMAALRKRLGM